jgi:putative membrane protein
MVLIRIGEAAGCVEAQRRSRILYAIALARILWRGERYMENSAERDPRVYFAAERTLLAWIRTGLGLVGVGFAVARFGLFLREIGVQRGAGPAHTTGVSLWSGVALVALGVLVNLTAVFEHYRLIGKLKAGSWLPGRISTSAVVLALLLAAVGVGVAVYLVAVR